MYKNLISGVKLQKTSTKMQKLPKNAFFLLDIAQNNHLHVSVLIVSFLLNLRHKTNKSKDKTNTKIEFSGVNVKQFPKIAFFCWILS